MIYFFTIINAIAYVSVFIWKITHDLKKLNYTQLFKKVVVLNPVAKKLTNYIEVG